MGSVRINTSPVANRYASPDEKIVEFSAGTDGAGGLISFTVREDGTIRVHVYRHESTTVTVGTPDGQPPA